MRRYGRLKQRDVLRLLRDGTYRVDTERGVVYGRKGEPLKPIPNTEGYLTIRLYDGERRVGVGLARLVWMARTGRIIPRGFEIHHRDKRIDHNGWRNLYCLYKDDHNKLHGGDLLDEEPFL